jgi:hypothetical protein
MTNFWLSYQDIYISRLKRNMFVVLLQSDVKETCLQTSQS